MITFARMSVVALCALAGCAKDAAPEAPKKSKVSMDLALNPPAPPEKTDPAGSPEAAYRLYMLANLEGTEAKIRPLIIDRPGAEILWQGPYSADTAKLLAGQYRGMDIERVAETPTRVTLKSMAAPMPIELVLVDKQWKVDPTPIIAFRQLLGK
ncbi:MAG: hypothetical protein Q8L48_43025 [Archangium sp.]|nr:hypothetical protein [Archangium sp.]